MSTPTPAAAPARAARTSGRRRSTPDPIGTGPRSAHAGRDRRSPVRPARPVRCQHRAEVVRCNACVRAGRRRRKAHGGPGHARRRASPAAAAGPARGPGRPSVCEALTPWRAEISDADQQHAAADDRADHAGAGQGEPGPALRRRRAGQRDRPRARSSRPGVPESTTARRSPPASSARWRRSATRTAGRRDTIDGLDTGRPTAFYDGVGPRSRRSTRSTTPARWTPAGSTRRSCKQAFDEVPECR